MGRISTLPFGYYMQQNYGNEYFVVNFLVGEGSIPGFDSLKARIHMPIFKPINGSIEKYAESLDCSPFYKNVTGLHSFNSGRNYGTDYRKLEQFCYFSHKGRFDAIVYVQQSKPSVLFSLPKEKDELLQFVKQRRQLNENPKISHPEP